MELSQRERLISRINSGLIRVRVRQDSYYICSPPPRTVYLANELFHEELERRRFSDCLSEDDVMELLVEAGLWTTDSDKHLETLPKDIEVWKTELYKAFFRSDERKLIKKNLAVAKAKLAEVSGIRHSLDHMTAVGMATIFKNRFLVAMGLQDEHGQHLFKTESQFRRYDGSIIDDVVIEIQKSRISEAEMREIARENPWRQLWSAANHEHQLFGISPSEYTEEQRALVSWSSLYDSVWKHPQTPPDDVIHDDDCLDGWLIIQRQVREKAQNVSAADELIGNEKIRNSGEVGIIARSREDVKRIQGLNSDESRAIHRQRLAAVSKAGVLREDQMPDTKLKIRMELNAMRARAGK